MKQSTEQLAKSLGVKAESIRSRFCRTGEYFGLRPEKLVNGRLLWPEDAQEKLIAPRLSSTSA